MASRTQIEHILDAASEHIVRFTFNKTTMDDIAHQAGISKSALYLIWRNKKQLFDALLAYQMQRLLQDFRQRLMADPASAEIDQLTKHTLLTLQNNPLMCALYTQDVQVLGDFVRHQNTKRYREQLKLNIEMTRHLQATGLIPAAIRPEVLSYVFNMLAVGFINMQAMVPPDLIPPLDEVAEAISHLVRQGIAQSGSEVTIDKQALLASVDLAIEQCGNELSQTTDQLTE